MKQLVTTDWLNENLNRVKILDASWHLPNTNRDALKEYQENHIKNAIFFDLDKNSDQSSKLPHMLSKKKDWEKTVSELGINNSDHVIVYDNSDVISACRVWYNFLYFGHDPNLISVLDGGFKKWSDEKKPVDNSVVKFSTTNYLANENKNMVIDKNVVNENIDKKNFQLIDARGKQRFLGLQPEPRPELRSGNISGSINLPYTELINSENKTFKNKDDLIKVFTDNNISLEKDMAFTCGSGVTACILGLANSIISGKKPMIYDGSWAEYGLKE